MHEKFIDLGWLLNTHSQYVSMMHCELSGLSHCASNNGKAGGLDLGLIRIVLILGRTDAEAEAPML